MKFVMLTLRDGRPIYVALAQIVAITPDDQSQNKGGTSIAPSTGYSIAVKESVDAVLKAIKKAEAI